MGRITARAQVRRIGSDGPRTVDDRLAVEEPLELRWAGRRLVITMRTPGHDLELAHGWLHAEGMIASRDDVAAARYCAGSDDQGVNSYNVLDVTPAADLAVVPRAREFVTSSACGVCGADSIEALRQRGRYPISEDLATISSGTLLGLPDRLAVGQKAFATTGGLHAAGLFTTAGEVVVVREDVGRHNAVDKVLGWALLNDRLPLSGLVLMVSGRASFELVQKAYLAGLPIMAAVSAPSSLAVQTASQTGLTLAGFVRGNSLNVYSHFSRIR